MQSIAVIARLPWSIALRARRTGGGERCVFECCFLVGRAALTTATPFAWF
jgi:hypothetical protein